MGNRITAQLAYQVPKAWESNRHEDREIRWRRKFKVIGPLGLT